MNTTSLAIELFAAAFGVLGTVLLALNGPRAGWGFVAYLASNAGWIVFASAHNHWGLLAQQLTFTASSLLGVWVWLVKPRGVASLKTGTAKPSPRSWPVKSSVDTPLMTNTELCEAIRLASDLVAEEMTRPILQDGPTEAQALLHDLIEIQRHRAGCMTAPEATP